MRPAIPSRFAAWLALAAMLASLALPAHAMPMRASTGFDGGDLCVGGKLVPAAPAGVDASHACDACCGSTPTAPPVLRAFAIVETDTRLHFAAHQALSLPAADIRAAQARAPPA